MEPISYLYRELILELVNSTNEDKGLDEDEQAFAIELKAKSLNLTNPLDFDEKQCKDIYSSIVDSLLSDYLSQIKSELREGKVETELIPEAGGNFESEAVAIPITGTPDLYVGWTYFFGGGKHSNPESVEWMENCYLVKAKDEVRTVRIFEREFPLDPDAIWEGCRNPES